jgi:hypothetical protein
MPERSNKEKGSMIMKNQKRTVDIVTKPEKCERGCGDDVAMTRRRDDGATRLSTIKNGTVLPGSHNSHRH